MSRRLSPDLSSFLALVLCALALPGCGGDDSASDDDPGPAPSTTKTEGSGGDASGAADAGSDDDAGPRPVDPDTVGSLAGRVTLSGPAPAREFVEMLGEAWCMGEHDEGGFLDDSLLVGDEGGVANVFVWIESGLDDWEFPDPEGPVVLDQVGCLYTPRVLGVRTKQELQALNSDAITHNVHTKGRNKEQNKSTPAGDTRSFEFKREEIMAEVVCDIHAWMKGWIGVVDHPLFAVTDAQGRWSLEGVPPGEYSVGIWHERLGQKSVTATVDANGSVTGLDAAF